MASPPTEKLPYEKAPTPTTSAIVADPKTGILYKINRSKSSIFLLFLSHPTNLTSHSVNDFSTSGDFWHSWAWWLSQILAFMLPGTWDVLYKLYPAYFNTVYGSYLRTMYVYCWVPPMQKLVLWGLVWVFNAGEKERAWVRTGRGPDGRVMEVGGLAKKVGEEEKGEVNGMGMGW